MLPEREMGIEVLISVFHKTKGISTRSSAYCTQYARCGYLYKVYLKRFHSVSHHCQVWRHGIEGRSRPVQQCNLGYGVAMLKMIGALLRISRYLYPSPWNNSAVASARSSCIQSREMGPIQKSSHEQMAQNHFSCDIAKCVTPRG